MGIVYILVKKAYKSVCLHGIYSYIDPQTKYYLQPLPVRSLSVSEFFGPFTNTRAFPLIWLLNTGQTDV